MFLYHTNTHRLRHEKLRPIKVDRGGPNEYQMLMCYPLASTPAPKPPSFVKAATTSSKQDIRVT